MLVRLGLGLHLDLVPEAVTPARRLRVNLQDQRAPDVQPIASASVLEGLAGHATHAMLQERPHVVGQHVGVELGHQLGRAALLRVDHLGRDDGRAHPFGPLDPRLAVRTLRDEVVEEIATPAGPVRHAVVLEGCLTGRFFLEQLGGHRDGPSHARRSSHMISGAS